MFVPHSNSELRVRYVPCKWVFEIAKLIQFFCFNFPHADIQDKNMNCSIQFCLFSHIVLSTSIAIILIIIVLRPLFFVVNLVCVVIKVYRFSGNRWGILKHGLLISETVAMKRWGLQDALITKSAICGYKLNHLTQEVWRTTYISFRLSRLSSDIQLKKKLATLCSLSNEIYWTDQIDPLKCLL